MYTCTLIWLYLYILVDEMHIHSIYGYIRNIVRLVALRYRFWISKYLRVELLIHYLELLIRHLFFIWTSI
jgi:hypothetical protein